MSLLQRRSAKKKKKTMSAFVAMLGPWMTLLVVYPKLLESTYGVPMSIGMVILLLAYLLW